MQHRKVASIIVCSILVFSLSLVFAVNLHQLFEVHTEVTAEEGITVWFASPGSPWWEVVDGSTYCATLKPGDVERFYIKIQHAGDTAINLLARITFPNEIELYAKSLPSGATDWWEDRYYYVSYTIEPGTIGEDYSIWIEYRLAGWVDLSTYTMDFNMQRG